MNGIDRWVAKLTRGVARTSSRRGFLARVATVLVGTAAVPLLPVARAQSGPRVPIPGEPDPRTAAGDPAECDYWRHCAIDGFLCGCCGGSQHACPPGTAQSPVTWIGTCRNPADGKDYIISYNDCCGKNWCGRCGCNRNEGERPDYHWVRNNDINWCVSAKSLVYHCSVAIVVGQATEAQPEK